MCSFLLDCFILWLLQCSISTLGSFLVMYLKCSILLLWNTVTNGMAVCSFFLEWSFLELLHLAMILLRVPHSSAVFHPSFTTFTHEMAVCSFFLNCSIFHHHNLVHVPKNTIQWNLRKKVAHFSSKWSDEPPPPLPMCQKFWKNQGPRQGFGSG